MDKSETYIKMCDCAEIQQPLFENVNDKILREIHSGLEGGDYIGDWLEIWEMVDSETKKRKVVGRVIPLSDYDARYIQSGYKVEYYYGTRECLGYGKHIWLPRQDQLQEMSAVKGAMGQMVALWNAIDDDVFFDCLDGASWEQLWLAFVMFQKYNKTWNGEEWKVVRSELCP